MKRFDYGCGHPGCSRQRHPRRRSTTSRTTARTPTTCSPTAWAITSSATARCKQINKSQRQAPGAGVEPQPRQRVGRAGAAARLQRRDVRHQRQVRRSRSTSRPASRSGARRSTGVPETPRVVCCGVSNKGVAIYNGKVFRTTLDAHVVALDQKTGKEIWKQKVAEWKEGYSHDGRAADRQRRADHRHLRRRVRHPRLHRRLGSRDRQAAVAPLHHPGAGREGQRDLAAGHDA